MSPKTPSLDSLCSGNCKCNCLKAEDALQAYKEAAEYDDYLFGDHDYITERNNDLEG